MKKQLHKRLLSLLLCCAMILGTFPAVSFAAYEDGLCQHHPEHTEECGYGSDSPCAFDCQECAAEAVNQAAEETEAAETTEEAEATEVTEATEETEATEVTEATEETEATEATEVTEETEATEAAEAAEETEATEATEPAEPIDQAVAYVQELIDALPEEVTADNLEAVQEQLEEIDEALKELTEDQLALLDFTLYDDVVEQVEILVNQAAEEEPSEAPSEEPVDETVVHVQELIDALPEEITAENLEAVQGQLEEIDEALKELSEDQIIQLYFAQFDNAISEIEGLLNQPEAENPIGPIPPESDAIFDDIEYGDITVSFSRSFYPNSKAFPNDSFKADGSNPYCQCGIAVGNKGHWCCWVYAAAAYKYIWGTGFSRDNNNNLLKSIGSQDRTITVDNLKKYFSLAAPGANLRLDNDPVPTNGDNDGHSMIFLGINENNDGAYFLEGNYDNRGSSRIYNWTWVDLVSKYGPSGSWTRYSYIKYIMWPNGSAGATPSYGYRNRYHCDVTFQVTTACDAWSMPGSDSTYSNSKIITTSKIPVGTQLKATEIIENNASVAGHYWYKTTVGGKEAYIYVPYTSHKTINWSVSVSGASKPTAINLGSFFAVKGTVQTGGSKITGIQGFVYPGNSTSGTPTISSVKATPNSTSYNLANEVDRTLIFNDIPKAGYYTYVVKADLSSYYMRDNTTPTLSTFTNVILSDTTSYFSVGSPAPQITITLNANGGTCSTSSTKIESGGTISNLPYPTRSGYIFEGWYTSPSGGTQITSSTTFSASTTVYAHWSTNYVHLGEGFYAKIIHSASGYGVSNVNGNIELGSLDKTALYYFIRNTDGTYTMISDIDGMVIDVYGNNTGDGTNIQTSTAVHEWFIQNDNGYYVFISANSGKAMDVQGGNTAKGTNVQLWTRNYSSAQLFSLKICTLKSTSQPEDVTVLENNWASFSVGATSSEGPITYQWYFKKPGDTIWYSIDGSTTSKLTVYTNKEMDGMQYSCLVYDQCGSHYWSNSATLHVSDLKITRQTTKITTYVNSNVTFSVTASSSKAISYQWMYRLPSNTNWTVFGPDINYSDKLTLTATKDLDGALIRCYVSDEYGGWLYSKEALLQVCDLAITQHPKDVTAALNSNVSFTVGVTSSKDISYQWQYRTSSSGTWQNSPATGNTTSKLTVPATTNRNGYQYRCVVTDSCGTKFYSGPATLKVSELKITAQPQSVTASLGQNVSFTVKATGKGLTYQWQYRSAGSSTWQNSPADGCKTNILKLSATTNRKGMSYRCIITDAGGNKLTSSVATLYINEFKITQQPANVTANLGQNVTFTVKATGTGLTYQWEYRSAGDTKWYTSPADGCKTNTLKLSATTNRKGMSYRCIITDASGKKLTSNAATLYINDFKITQQPVNVTANLGQNVTFTVKATGTGLTYQWEYRSAGDTKWYTSPADGNKTNTLKLSATTNRKGMSYRCIITDATGKKLTSNVATLYINEFKITQQPVNVTANLGQNVTFTVKATGTGLTYRWEYRSAGTTTWKESPADGCKTNTLKLSATTNRKGMSYRCIITDATGKKLTSNVATLYINEFKITHHPQSQTVSLGQNVTFSVKATGSGLTYQWEYLSAGSSTWKVSPADGNKTNTLKLSATTNRDGMQYRCVVTDSSGKKLTSMPALLTIG